MSEVEKCWQAIDRGIGYVQGFMPTIWVLMNICDREIVDAESIGEFEQVVGDLACSLARVRELMEVER